MSKFSRLTFIAFMLFTLLAAKGCGSGGDDGGPGPVPAYLYGELHGELASDLKKDISFIPYDGTASDRPVIISKINGAFPLEQTIGEGLRKAYNSGQIAAIEHASQDEVNTFLGVLGLPQDFQLDSADQYVEIFALQKMDAGIHRYITLSDDGQYVTAGSVTSADMSTQEASNRVRSFNFTGWLQNAEIRNQLLNWRREQAISAIVSASGDRDNLMELANSNITTYDASENGETYLIHTTSYSAHSFKPEENSGKERDWFAITQTAQLNPSARYSYKDGRYYMFVPQPSEISGWMRRYKFTNHWDETMLRDMGYNLNSTEFKNVQNAPETVNNRTTTTSGVEYGIEGNVGFSGKSATGGLSAHMVISSSQSVEISDCSVINDSGKSGGISTAIWNYKFNDPITGKNHAWYCDISAVPLSTSNFQPVNSWIWSSEADFRTIKDGKRPVFTTAFERTYGKGYGPSGTLYAMIFPAKYEDWYTVTRTFSTPVDLAPLIAADASAMDFTKNGGSKALKLVSARNWTLESGQGSDPSQWWCKLSGSQVSGNATGENGLNLHVETMPNDTGDSRSTTLVFKAENGDLAEIKIYQSQYEN